MTKVTCPDDIPKLPWKGNWRDDERLFDACNEYIASEPDPRRAYEAERFTHLYGMGIKLPRRPRTEDLDYMKEQHKQWVRYGTASP